MFITIDTVEINKIPLNNLDEEDCLSWKARKNGHYTVKTGYYNIMEWKHTQNEGYFKKDNDKEVWKKMWDIKAPPRKLYLL